MAGRFVTFVHRHGLARTLNCGGGPARSGASQSALLLTKAPSRKLAVKVAKWRLRHDPIAKADWDGITVTRAARLARFTWRVQLGYRRI